MRPGFTAGFLVLDVILIALELYMYLVLIWVILSWLIAFNVVNTRNPIVAGIRLANLVTGGLAGRQFCISMEELQRRFLVQHFMQHYVTMVGSLLTWRRDEEDSFAFHCTVPEGATSVEVNLDYLASNSRDGFTAAASMSWVARVYSPASQSFARCR